MTQPYIDKWGFQPIEGITGFFKADALPDNFTDLCSQDSRRFKMKAYTVDGEPLLAGFLVTIKETNIKEVTSQCFPEDWWYDRAYVLRTGTVFLLWVQKMYSTMSYLSILESDDLSQYGIQPTE